MRRLLLSVLFLPFAGCGSDPEPNPVPSDATALSSYAKSGATTLVLRMTNLEAIVPFVLNPGSPGSGGLTFTPTGAPNTYTFGMPIDGDGNGSNETTVAGTAAFNGDPAAASTGFAGHLDLTLTTAGGLGNFSGEMDFVRTAAGRVATGSGTFVEGVTGNMTTLTVPVGSPLLLKPADGTASAVANICGYSLHGDAQLEVQGPAGTLASTWQFRSTRAGVAVTGASYTDNSGHTTDLPDATITFPCAGTGTLADWSGVFLQNWACLPVEYGQATHTYTVTGNTLHISDEDPPGSGDINTYTAAPVAGNPYEVRGYFIGGPAGSTYREDFTWKLSPNGNLISEVSHYVYQEGPNIGTGGMCGGRAVRQ
jgi:hypothetical protein